MTIWPVGIAPPPQRPPEQGPATEAEIDAQAEGRVRLAARLDLSPLALQELARDPEILVRATVALNGRCDAEVDAILTSDQDERIRALLGSRVARLLPNLDSEGRTAAATHVLATLAILAADQATRVRAAIADEIAAMDSAPRDLVLRLARDTAGAVSNQVIRLSPVLSDADLLSILATPHSPKTAESIASREKLSAVVADAIVQHADAPTIRALLSNQSACIREATLDALVGRAPNHLDWHAPLVRRPRLSTYAVRALSEFIASDLLRTLAIRADLEPGKLEIVRQRLAASAPEKNDQEALIAKARHLKASGQLTEAALQAAASQFELRQLLAMLAVSSDVSLQTVERVMDVRSTKALVSLVWRSGFSMTLAVSIQKALSHFAPETIIYPTEDGTFPLSAEEMTWQVELINKIEPNAR